MRAFIPRLAAILVGFTFRAYAQTPFPAPSELERGANGIALTTNSGITSVEVWTDQIMRVTHRPAASDSLSSSLAVIAKPEKASWKLTEENGEAVLTTAQRQVRVDKSTGRVQFLDGSGAAVLSETERGTWLSASIAGSAGQTLSVGQRFVLAPGESIYGPGQHPEKGVMDYVGTSVRLHQGVGISNLKELEAVKGTFNPAIPYVYPKGRGKWYDPFNDRARGVYWKLMSKNLFSQGVDAWWLDASEAELSGKWGEFRDFSTGKGSGAPIQTMPLFVKAGAILPYGPAVQYANEKLTAPLELRVYGGADGSFTLYEDGGDSYDYEHGAYATIPLRWNERTQALTIGVREGSFPGMIQERSLRVVWVKSGHGVGISPTEHSDAEVTYRGEEIVILAPRL